MARASQGLGGEIRFPTLVAPLPGLEVQPLRLVLEAPRLLARARVHCPWMWPRFPSLVGSWIWQLADFALALGCALTPLRICLQYCGLKSIIVKARVQSNKSEECSSGRKSSMHRLERCCQPDRSRLHDSFLTLSIVLAQVDTVIFAQKVK